MGGLAVRAMVATDMNHGETAASRHVRKVSFLGTPNAGSRLADYTRFLTDALVGPLQGLYGSQYLSRSYLAAFNASHGKCHDNRGIPFYYVSGDQGWRNYHFFRTSAIPSNVFVKLFMVSLIFRNLRPLSFCAFGRVAKSGSKVLPVSPELTCSPWLQPGTLAPQGTRSFKLHTRIRRPLYIPGVLPTR